MSDESRHLAAVWLLDRQVKGEPSESEVMDIIALGLRRAAEIAQAKSDFAQKDGWMPSYVDACESIIRAIESEIAKDQQT